MSDATASELAGRTALVTGASSGIGAAIAIELATAGADVAVHAGSRRDAAERVAERVRACGGRATVLIQDLTQEDACRILVKRVWDWAPEIDIWINNAGADVLTGEAAEWGFQGKLDLLWRVDVLATIQLSRLAGTAMQRRRRGAGQTGVILNMGWDQAESGMAGDSGEMFATIKGAIMAFSRSLARSLAPDVRVNCLAPGWIRTAWSDQASDYWQQRAAAESLLDRWGTPQDVARVARYLVSDDARFLTGQIVRINGGFRSEVELWE
jgi:3-oxoacyl-[acyl-carrier protein] reductase